jgi:hypothetical protein
VVIGRLYDVSLYALLAFAVAAQLVAIPLFIAVKRTEKA